MWIGIGAVPIVVILAIIVWRGPSWSGFTASPDSFVELFILGVLCQIVSALLLGLFKRRRQSPGNRDHEDSAQDKD
jgi:hypothetical protein